MDGSLFLGGEQLVVLGLADTLVTGCDTAKFIVGGITLDAHAVGHVQGVLAADLAVLGGCFKIAIDIANGEVLVVGAQHFEDHVGFTLPLSYVAAGIFTAGVEEEGRKQNCRERENLFHVI